MDLDRTGIDDDLSRVLDGLSKAYDSLADAVDRAEGFLLGKKLKQPTFPNVPACLPLYSAPIA